MSEREPCLTAQEVVYYLNTATVNDLHSAGYIIGQSVIVGKDASQFIVQLDDDDYLLAYVARDIAAWLDKQPGDALCPKFMTPFVKLGTDPSPFGLYQTYLTIHNG